MPRELQIDVNTGERRLGDLPSLLSSRSPVGLRTFFGWAGNGDALSSPGPSRHVLLLPVITMITFITYMGFLLVNFTVLTEPRRLYEVVTFWQSSVCFVPVLLTIHFYSTMRIAVELSIESRNSIKEARSSDQDADKIKDQFVERCGQWTWHDFVHMLLIYVFWLTLRLVQTNHFWNHSLRGNILSGIVACYIAISTQLFINMRAKLFAYNMLGESFEKIRARSEWLVLVQLALGMYVVVKSSSTPPLTREVTVDRYDGGLGSLLLPDACGAGLEVFNETYFDQYCRFLYEKGQRSSMDGLNRVCKDGGWTGFRSRYDACSSSMMTEPFYVDAYSALGISMNLFFLHVFLSVKRLREHDTFKEGTSHTMLNVIKLAVGLCLLVAMFSAMIYSGCIVAVRVAGPVADFIYDVYLDLTNLGAWFLIFVFINIEVFTRKAKRIYRKVRKRADAEEWAAFLSHTWTGDELGRDNHARVRKINDALRVSGVSTWFDDTHMEDSTDHAMTSGIEGSTAILVFITEAYIEKVIANDGNNVQFEFEHAVRQKGATQFITVCMEPVCRSANEWKGPVGARLGGKLYHNFDFDFEPESGNDEQFKAAIEALVEAIQSKANGAKQADSANEWIQVVLNPISDALTTVTDAIAMTFSGKSRSPSQSAADSFATTLSFGKSRSASQQGVEGARSFEMAEVSAADDAQDPRRWPSAKPLPANLLPEGSSSSSDPGHQPSRKVTFGDGLL